MNPREAEAAVLIISAISLLSGCAPSADASGVSVMNLPARVDNSCMVNGRLNIESCSDQIDFQEVEPRIEHLQSLLESSGKLISEKSRSYMQKVLDTVPKIQEQKKDKARMV